VQPSPTDAGASDPGRVHADPAVRRVRILRPVKVLVVDDDPALRDAVRRALRLEGYDVETAAGGIDALGVLARDGVDAVVLDVMMPDLDGLAVCRHLRRESDRTPVLMLTARDAVGDRVAGLDAGADDYLVKPFALEELLARVRALLRRATPDHETLTVGDLVVDTSAREVRRGSRSIELTRTEFGLLELLARNARVVVPRDVIFDRVWGYPIAYGSNTLDVYVGYLRRKTEAGGEPRLIHTVRGVGFVLRPADPS
jgi:two-component system, OmpR family, response regulator MprA